MGDEIGDSFWNSGLYDTGLGDTYDGGMLNPFYVDTPGYDNVNQDYNPYPDDYYGTNPYWGDTLWVDGSGIFEDPNNEALYPSTGSVSPGGAVVPPAGPRTPATTPARPQSPSGGSSSGGSSSGSNSALSAITKGISDLAKLVNSVLNTVKPPTQTGQAGGLTQPSSPVTPELLLLGGLAGGLVLFLYLRKR